MLLLMRYVVYFGKNDLIAFPIVCLISLPPFSYHKIGRSDVDTDVSIIDVTQKPEAIKSL